VRVNGVGVISDIRRQQGTSDLWQGIWYDCVQEVAECGVDESRNVAQISNSKSLENVLVYRSFGDHIFIARLKCASSIFLAVICPK
jgi:hypothetical protein